MSPTQYRDLHSIGHLSIVVFSSATEEAQVLDRRTFVFGIGNLGLGLAVIVPSACQQSNSHPRAQTMSESSARESALTEFKRKGFNRMVRKLSPAIRSVIYGEFEPFREFR